MVLRHWQKYGAVGLVVVLGLAGCSQSKVTQCNQLTEQTNQTVEAVQGIVQANATPNPEALLQVAERFDQGKTDIETLQINDPQLNTYRQQFASMYAEVSSSARELASALENQDFEAARPARETFQTATSKEAELVEQVNTYCGAPTSTEQP
ncbi:hypothetical protein ACQ4M4_17345 [Leptolyngbya sp. AN02str]|uniref:hypothetical protein n=1 Tax=Leptolyngbya sp. AN02str TaxID=3423363 RepID=UPI003D314488